MYILNSRIISLFLVLLLLISFSGIAFAADQTSLVAWQGQALAATTSYSFPGVSSASDWRAVMPIDASLKNFTIAWNTGDTIGVGENITVTLEKNGSPTGVEIVLTDASAAVVSDVDEISFSAGDTWNIKMVGSGGAGDCFA